MTNEMRTLNSIKRIRAGKPEHKDGEVYLMKVYGGYHFDEFLSSGQAESDEQIRRFAAEKLVKRAGSFGFKTPEAGCSSFTAATEAGKRLFARNFDLSPSNMCIVYTTGGKGRHATVTSVDLKYLGIPQDRPVKGTKAKYCLLAAPYAPVDGMNDAGLCASVYICTQGDQQRPTRMRTGKPPISSTTLLRLMLDKASNVGEAVALAKQYDLYEGAADSFHYSVTDRSGKTAVLEYIGTNYKSDNDPENRQLKITYNVDKLHFEITNYVLYPGYYEDEDQKSGYDRLCIMNHILEQSGGKVKDADAALNILAEVGCRKLGRKAVTLHSVVYNMDDLTAKWVSNEHFEDRYSVFSLKL